MRIVAIALVLFTFNLYASTKTVESAELNGDLELLSLFKSTVTGEESLKLLKSKTLKLASKAVPTLIKVMKTEDFPEKNRWVATFLLGQIMGEKSSAFIAKFTAHPKMIMRLASLKTLLSLSETKYAYAYQTALSDKSLLVRYQALENIRLLKVKSLGASVWKLLLDKSNYEGSEGGLKRSSLIKNVIKTIGELQYEPVKEHLYTMIQKDNYKDIYQELDYSLSQLTGKTSPDGDLKTKRVFWQKNYKKI
jgi:hypothetical protein